MGTVAIGYIIFLLVGGRDPVEGYAILGRCYDNHEAALMELAEEGLSAFYLVDVQAQMTRWMRLALTFTIWLVLSAVVI